MRELFFRIFQHLLPDARAFRILLRFREWVIGDPVEIGEPGLVIGGAVGAGKWLERLFFGLANVFAKAREYIDLAYLDMFVDDTRELALHQEHFGLLPVGTEDDQLAAVRAAWRAQGGQSPAYLQSIVQEAGFDLYVHEWWGSGTLARLLGALLEAHWSLEAENVALEDDFVASALDLAGNAHTLSAGGAGTLPAYEQNAGPGGRRAVATADGANDTLSAGGFAFAEGDRPSLVIVARWVTLPAADESLAMLVGPGGLYVRIWFDESAGTVVATVQYEGGASADIVGPDADTDWHVFQLHLLSTGWLFRVDDADFTSVRTEGVSDAGEGGASTLFLPPGGPNVSLREAVVLNGEPNAEQVLSITNLFAERYWPLAIDVTPHDPREYTEVPVTGTVQCGEPLAMCGEPTALCNNFLANDPHYLVNQEGTQFAPPAVPASPAMWPYFLYFGAERFPELADVPAERRRELNRLLLKHCPDEQWIVLLVNYT